jgi:hypothetical protein
VSRAGRSGGPAGPAIVRSPRLSSVVVPEPRGTVPGASRHTYVAVR